MKFLDLDREYEYFDWQEVIFSVFKDKDFINGKVVLDFEKAVENYMGVKYALGVSSGTDALWVSLLSLGIKNPTILTTPYSFVSIVEVSMRYGAKVVFCDIDESFNIDINKCKEVMSKNKIDIFIPVHLFGLPCNLDDELLEVCSKNGTYIIEDAAQAFGSMLYGSHVGTIGDIGCFSFFPAKNLGCAGDGGMVVTNSQEIYKKAKMIRNHGSCAKYKHTLLGGNFRLDTIQASLLLKKMEFIDIFLATRHDAAMIYNRYFDRVYDLGIILPEKGEKYNAVHTYNQYVIRVKENRDDLACYFKKRGIPTAKYYPRCLSQQPIYINYDFQCDCKNSKKIAGENLALPIAYMTKEEVICVVSAIRDFYEGKR